MLKSNLYLAIVVMAILPSHLSHAAESGTAGDSLAFEDVLDGKCHILSEGGKLTLMHNRHSDARVRYRLVRLFVDRPQGLVDGEIGPTETVKLGCNRVGSRPQTWRIVRASLVTKGTP